MNSDWKEITIGGKTQFFNKKTGITQMDRPGTKPKAIVEVPI